MDDLLKFKQSIIQDPDTMTTVPHKAGGTGAGSDQKLERRRSAHQTAPIKALINIWSTWLSVAILRTHNSQHIHLWFQHQEY